jgi:hypothetical protein
MDHELKRIEYRRGMVESSAKLENLRVKVWRRAEVFPTIAKWIDEEGILDLGGVYGDERAGDPVEYDYLKLTLADDEIEITVFNRGIALLMSRSLDEGVVRIHRFLCKLDDAEATDE